MEIQAEIIHRGVPQSFKGHEKAGCNRVQDHSQGKRAWNPYNRSDRIYSADVQAAVFPVIIFSLNPQKNILIRHLHDLLYGLSSIHGHCTLENKHRLQTLFL